MLRDGLRRQDTHTVRQAQPMTHDILRKNFLVVDLMQELHAVAWTGALVAFTLILRVSNIGPDARDEFDPFKHFLRSDLVVKQGVLTMKVRWSKTIQY